MELKTCPNNHFYDGSKYSTCPQCANSEIGSTVPLFADTPQAVAVADIGKTMPIGSTMPINETQPISPTMPVSTPFDFNMLAQGGGNEPQEYSPTVAHDEAVLGFNPTVAWVVCISGPAKGKDYRIQYGYNHIGRNDSMDICISEDTQISRDSDSTIAFDQISNKAFFFHTGGRNLVYHNNVPVTGAVELNAKDILTIGGSKLIYIPLCGEGFEWKDV